MKREQRPLTTPGRLSLALVVLGFLAPPSAAQRVTIYRDDWGAPHLYADREADGYYGMGYAMAEDALDQVLLRFLAARGELAAAFGEKYVEADLETRRWRVVEDSRVGFSRLPAQLQQNYRAFVAGIARYMRDHPEQVPPWAPRLEPWLPVARWVNMAFPPFYLGGGLAKCTRAGATIGEGLEAIRRFADDAAVLGASNVWALMPWRTADGAVVHVTDPHGNLPGPDDEGKFEPIEFRGAFTFWTFRMDAGPIKTVGFNLIGLPWSVGAHTRYAAWGNTAAPIDVADCYEVEVDPRDPTRYRYDGRWQRMVVEQTTIAVKDAPPRRVRLEYTRHNGGLSPVVSRSGGKAWVISTPYMHRAGGHDVQMYAHLTARSLEEFRAAHDRREYYASNLLAGTADGHVIFVRNGRYPVRPAGFDWNRAVPGNTSATAWAGIHPLTDLVQLVDPASGYIQVNNVAPDRIMEQSPLSADRYPPYLFAERPGATNSRGIRAVELLSRTYHASLADLLAIVTDEKWVGAERWIEALRTAAEAAAAEVPSRPLEQRRAIGRLLGFDGQARQESRAALLFFYWQLALAADTAGYRELSAAVEANRPPATSRQKQLVDAIGEALSRMRSELGDTELTYGDVFRAGRGGVSLPLGGGPIRLGSQPTQTLRAWGFTPPDSTGRRWVTSGQHFQLVTVFTDPIRSFDVLPLGQSARPGSPHYSDQARLISERRLRPTYFYREDLEGHIASEVTLDVDLP